MEIADQILKSNYVSVPRKVLKEIAKEFGRKEKFEAALRVWELFFSFCRDSTNSSRWTVIPDRAFSQVVKSSSTKNEIKRFFRRKKIIKVWQWTLGNGEIKDRMIPNEMAKSYRLNKDWLGGERRIPIGGEFHRHRYSYTQSDSLCEATRRNLDLLHIDREKLNSFVRTELLETENSKLEKIESAIKTVHFRIGGVTRGNNVNRLFSPWTHMPKIARPMFKLDGESIIEFDLSCSQPTLLAQLISDEKLMNACFDKQLYPMIIKRFGCPGKEEAKRLLFLYLYGPNREAHHRPIAVEVQAFFQKEFPEAAAEVWRRKSKVNHRRFNRTLQDFEAEIFVDGALRKLVDLGVPSLSIHDCLCVKRSDADLCLDVLRSKLEQAIPNKKFNLSRLDFETGNEKLVSGIF